MRPHILVVLEDNNKALTPYALSAAALLGAHVTAVRPRRSTAGLGDGSLEARYEAASGDAEARKRRAREALDEFAREAAGAGLEAEVLRPDDGQDPSRDQIAQFARAFDFAILGQGEPGRPPAADDLIAGMLADSGRPVLVVPAIQRDSARFQRLVFAWDGGVAAARAFGQATALFELARTVEIASVTTPATPHSLVQTGERLARRLARDGKSATFRRLPTDEDPANTLLSYVADVSADALIAGGYGHSRLREALFGGATRTFLTSATIPLFLAH